MSRTGLLDNYIEGIWQEPGEIHPSVLDRPEKSPHCPPKAREEMVKRLSAV